MTALPTPRAANDSTERPLVPTREDLHAFNEHTRALEEAARVRDLAFEMLGLLESVSNHTRVMEFEFSSALRARIRRVIKEAHGE